MQTRFIARNTQIHMQGYIVNPETRYVYVCLFQYLLLIHKSKCEVRPFAQGHFNMWAGGGGRYQTVSPVISGTTRSVSRDPGGLR